ncbi:hypothetical protein DVS28_a2931 [Euzebya pacifica]|uniref:DUF732 domain-containing protein n=1 Tax=Euzebya pacifica TaxID=1608957 RepID=A0A346XZG3_9ACTN|nr:DUF732 domain-containing protein [Euzebya pacifica]AXV07610.1 hypothetical protein DVS28_a2931 [Euzebya pacifica]
MQSRPVLALLTLLVLAGCAGEATPETAGAGERSTPTPTPAAVVTAEPVVTVEPVDPEEAFLAAAMAARPDRPSADVTVGQIERTPDDDLLHTGQDLCAQMRNWRRISDAAGGRSADIEERFVEPIDLRRELMGVHGFEDLDRINFLQALGQIAAGTLCPELDFLVEDWVAVAVSAPDGAATQDLPAVTTAAEVAYIEALRAGPLRAELASVPDDRLLEVGVAACALLDSVAPSSALEWAQYLAETHSDDTALSVSTVTSAAAMTTLCPEWSRIL